MWELFNINPSITKRYIYFGQSLRAKAGIKYAIKYMKTARLHITRYICGSPMYVNNCGVGVTKEGFPIRLLYLKDLIDSREPIKLRAVLSLLSYNRAIVPTCNESLKITPDFSTITDEYKGKDYTIPVWFIIGFIEKFKLKSDVPRYTTALHYISSKGSAFGKSTLSATYALLEMSKKAHTHVNNLCQLSWYYWLYVNNRF